MAKYNEEKQKKQREEDKKKQDEEKEDREWKEWKKFKGWGWRSFRKIKYFWYCSLWIKAEKSVYSRYLNIWRNWPGITRFRVSFLLIYS